MRYYSCDLEATIQPDATWQTAAELDTEVWLAAARNYRDANDYHLFYDMDDYMQWALGDGSKNLTFHNPKGYDYINDRFRLVAELAKQNRKESE